MARAVTRGDLWTYAFTAPDKLRPVLVLTRSTVIPMLANVMVAPVTTSIRGLPSEVGVGRREGLKTESVVNLDNVQTVAKSRLRDFIGRLDVDKLHQVCRALGVATGCDD